MFVTFLNSEHIKKEVVFGLPHINLDQLESLYPPKDFDVNVDSNKDHVQYNQGRDDKIIFSARYEAPHWIFFILIHIIICFLFTTCFYQFMCFTMCLRVYR